MSDQANFRNLLDKIQSVRYNKINYDEIAEGRMMKRLLSVATALVLALGCAAFAACEEDVGNSGDDPEAAAIR